MTDPDDNMALSASITETHVPTNKIPRQATFPKNQPLTMKSPPYKPTVDILERDHLPQDKSNTDTLPNKTLTTPMQLPRQATKPHANQVEMAKPQARSGYCHDRTLPRCNRSGSESGPGFNPGTRILCFLIFYVYIFFIFW